MVAKPQGVLADADAFVLLGFGLGVGADGRLAPGVSNLALAKWVVAYNPCLLYTSPSPRD